MTGPGEGHGSSSGTMRRSAATIVFLAIAAGAVLSVTILAVLGSIDLDFPRPDLPMTAVRIVGLALLIVGFTVTGVLSGSIPPRQPDQDEGTWWKSNAVKAGATWAMAEGIAIFGGVLFFLTGDLVLLAGLGGGGLVILMLNRPGRMMEG